MPNLAWEKNIETTKKYCKCGSKIGSSLVVRTNSHSNQEASILRVWLLVVKCCSPWSRLTLHPLSSNNVDFWNYIWEPTIEKNLYHVQHPNPIHPTKKLKRDSLKKTSLIAELLPWSMHLYDISITSVKIDAGWHCGKLPWSMVPRVHLRRWLFFEPSHNLSLET